MSAKLLELLEVIKELGPDKVDEDSRKIVKEAIFLYESQDPVFFAEHWLGIKPWSKQAEVLKAVEKHPRVAVRSGHKVGKLLSDDTPIPTPSGWKRHGDLVVGDEVFSETGLVCHVTAVMPWTDRPLMRVTFEDGSWIDADERHEWVVHTRESRKRTHKRPQTLETGQLATRITASNGRSATFNWTVDLPFAIDLPVRNLSLDPYLLGVWLGDGHSASPNITTSDPEIEAAFNDAGYGTAYRAQKGKAWTFAVDPANGRAGYVSAFRRGLAGLGVLGNKHIPSDYLWSSEGQRLALLQGLMDTDGTASARGRASFTNTNELLARGVLHLARSLGIKARIHERRAKLNGRDMGPVWNVGWQSRIPVFRLARKLLRIRRAPTTKTRAHKRLAIVSITPIPGRHSGRCIEVDSSSHLYLAGESMVPTHNSTSAAILALWWMIRWPDGRVVLTAPTGRQVSKVLWREVQRLYRNSIRSLGGSLHKTADQGLQYDDGREIIGFSTDEPERFAGISGPHVLYIVDEGSGVSEVIYEAIEGNRAGGAHLAVFGNPTQNSGTFYDAFNTKRDGWHTIHISSEDSPNVTGEVHIPGLATRQWVEEKLREWGEKNPLFQVRVRGDFPDQAENAVISVKVIEEAMERWTYTEPLGALEIGVDVARFGDDETVIWPVRGKKALEPIVLHSMATTEVVGKVIEVANGLRVDGETATVKVDVIGVGAGVADQLRGHENIHVIDVNVAESSNIQEDGQPVYHRLRDQLWFTLDLWLRDGGALPDDYKLHEELRAPTYTITELGKRKVMSKDDIKEVIQRSPDRADALALAVYRGGKTTMDLFLEAGL